MVRLQLASVGTEDSVKPEMARLQRRYGDLLKGLALNELRVDIPSRGVVYRLQVGPLPQAQAVSLCEQLRAARAD